MYLLYNLGLYLATVVLFPWLVYRMLRGRLPGLGERFGILHWEGFPPGTPVVWIHAVSMGEVKSAATLVKDSKIRIPDIRFVITSSTKTGWNAAKKLVGPQDHVLFPPFDLAFICRRFLGRIRPNAMVVLETELWPNLFRECKRYGAALLIVNGRISDRTFPRYLASHRLWRRVLAWPDGLFPQSLQAAERYRALGAHPTRIHPAGNLKFASHPSPSPMVDELREMLGDAATDPVIVAGSTMPGEEEYLLDAFQQLIPEFPRLRMILAPRHPERFVAVKEQIEARGIPLQLRSQWKAGNALPSPGILLLDSMGELGAIYEIATVAYVGGTLVPSGGHNILEPAYFARPIVIGPSMTNFQEIADEFLQDAGADSALLGENTRAGAIIQILDAASLAPVFRLLLQNPDLRLRLGNAARERCERNFNSATVIIDELQRLLTQQAATTLSTAPLARQAIATRRTD